ncbi:bifunctional hydroxymethylpyrimidine kinase/phosphomethylpyrimidine kinase [Actinocrinis puniceicyclus]|uniref:Bifunctional hydroxymethylpyrimidine kinase/phosphomethylpyrimidine kinase n=1 Tax=Actinocrinis puniceicyclus TaxID=977794 RepID=A0A8J8B9W1_9ACTN|nr:PfkB family carbohydrate kinase [Actinocrinis puniceicyclus]MBS2961448.1 bifunctional hydroxymethylpyrimidine kinase/phosphomethylpyrimidine kinase [Actinocrinis puniceicyclus]
MTGTAAAAAAAAAADADAEPTEADPTDGEAQPKPEVVVFGQAGRDLVLPVDELPQPGTSAVVHTHREVLGGKGANQAVSFARLGVPVALVAVLGDDRAGDEVLAQARADGIDVSCVVRRTGTATGLIVEVLDCEHRWRYLEDLPEAVRLTRTDVEAAARLLTGADSAVIQLQQPAAACLAAAALARASGCRVVLDGAPRPEHRRALLRNAHVLRADAHEAELLTGRQIHGVEDAVRAAGDLVDAAGGPELVALAVEGEGNLFAWEGGHVFYPLDDTDTMDTTGAGDSFVAALTSALAFGEPPQEAGRWAVAASGLTVQHSGGRPRMTAETLQARLAMLPVVSPVTR